VVASAQELWLSIIGTKIFATPRREKMDSKQRFRSGKRATQCLHQIAVDIAAMRVLPHCGRYFSRRINGRTDITWSAAAAARIGCHARIEHASAARRHTGPR
jgi:hypothetical protein